MIKDKIKNINRYSINEYFDEFKENFRDLNSLPTKLNPPFKAIPLEYETGSLDFSKFENHKKYIDIHLMVDGSEIIGLSEELSLDNLTEYDVENDFQLFTGEAMEEIALHQGEFLLLFPGEIHVTGGKFVENEIVKKIVYKVPFNRLNREKIGN